MTRLIFIASAVALALGITAAHLTGQPLIGIPFLFAAAFYADLYQRRRTTAQTLREARARASLADRATLPPADVPEFTPCCQFWTASAGHVHSSRCRTGSGWER